MTPQVPDQNGTRQPRYLRNFVVPAGLLVLVLFGLAALAAATGWQDTMEQLAKLGWPQLAALLALSLANYGFRGLRWHIFARRLGLATTLTQNLRHYIGGFAMTVTPGRIGELVRMRWLARETGWPFARTAPLILADRASDLAAMAVILAVALVFSATGIVGALPVALLALIGAVLATRPRLLAGLANAGFATLRRWPRFFARIRSAARSLARFSNPSMMSLAALIGALGWFAEAYAFYLLLGWLGADLSLPDAAAIFIFATLAGGLTGAPGGIGGAEAAMVGLLILEDVAPEISLAATAIIRLTTLWFAIALGLLIFPLAERRSKKVCDALAKN